MSSSSRRQLAFVLDIDGCLSNEGIPIAGSKEAAAVDEDSGDTYYCNEKTGVATWDFPTEPAIVDENDSTNKLDYTPVESPVEDEGNDLPPGWFAVTDPASGDTYYVHDQSGETTWDHPGKGIMNEEFMSSRMSVTETNTVFEDDSVTSSQY